MARPDPANISKQPVARASAEAGRILRSAARSASDAGPLRLFAADGRLDLDAVFRLVDRATVIVEGRVYASAAAAGAPGGPPVFLGTALLTVDLASAELVDAPVDAAFAMRVRDALARDRRSPAVFRDRAAREAARLLGPESPAELTAVPTLRCRETTLLIDLDLEGQVEQALA